MKFDVLFALPGIALTVLCWGTYGPVLHKGQAGLAGDRYKPLICVGAAYLIVAIIVPVVILSMNGKLSSGWSFSGISWSLAAGVAGALGALGIIIALTAGGRPVFVMPLVFGGAPIINVFVAMYFAKIPWKSVHPIFYSGLIMVVIGAILVLVFQPRTSEPHAAKPVVKKEIPSQDESFEKTVDPTEKAT